MCDGGIREEFMATRKLKFYISLHYDLVITLCQSYKFAFVD